MQYNWRQVELNSPTIKSWLGLSDPGEFVIHMLGMCALVLKHES